ncbi:hypothetical protein J3458_021414 [Metarhizium acridum]|uniref:uncharacterized protein n=1 Tax=Metarhizium acridum TaxID=92637 RepID=UPI001C6B57E4|nr:hypothetical protein J3458_021414 [Metarhizium acridum]
MESSQCSSTRPREGLGIIFDHKLTNAPAKSIFGVQLEYHPKGFTTPHRHGGANVVAVIQEGQGLSGMKGNPPKVYHPGESFSSCQGPGYHHTVGDNNRKVEGAKFMAVLVVDTEVLETQGYEGLMILD